MWQPSGHISFRLVCVVVQFSEWAGLISANGRTCSVSAEHLRAGCVVLSPSTQHHSVCLGPFSLIILCFALHNTRRFNTPPAADALITLTNPINLIIVLLLINTIKDQSYSQNYTPSMVVFPLPSI